MKKLAFLCGLVVIASCASTPPPPSSPGILVLPGTGKSFDQFLADDRECRKFALAETTGKGEPADLSYSHAAIVLQQRYDNAFAQCMFARGHKVPVSGPYSDRGQPAQAASRTPPPPPPPGQPPPEAPPDYRPK